MQDIENLKPREPGPSECCGSGCARCVWDVYFDEYAKWEARRAQSSSEDTPAVPTVFSLSEPSPTGCSSYLGSVVLKYVDFEGEEDDFGVACPSDAVTPLWKEAVVGSAPLAISFPNENASGGGPRDLELVMLRVADGVKVDTSLYSPGDVLELYVPNSAAVVSSLCKHFRLPESRLVQLKASPFVNADCFPPWIPQRRNITVRDLLSYYVDVSSSAYVRKPFLSLLHKCVAEQHLAQRTALQQLSDQHKLLHTEVSTTFPSLLDMLDAFGPYFNASGIPLAKFLEVSAPLRSRKFSIVDVMNAPPVSKDSETTFLICARRIMNERCPSSSPSAPSSAPVLALPTSLEQRFEGHVSHALFSASSSAAAVSSPLWLRRPVLGTSLIPKAFATRPLMLFCGGSGIGPALSVLVAAHKMQTAASDYAHAPQPVPRWLFFSSRSIDEAANILGRHSIVNSAVRATCSRVLLNVSRGGETAIPLPATLREEPITVVAGRMDALLRGSEAQEIYKLFHESKAAILACGPSGFLTSTREALTSVLFPAGAEDDSSVSEQQWKMGEMNGNIVFEDWNQRK
jgi:hypothetical protein